MARQIGGILARVEYAPLAAFAGVLAAIPIERAVRVGAQLGGLVMRLDRFNRPVALRNLEIAFPEMDRAGRLRILAGMYRNWGRMLAEWTHFDELGRGSIACRVTYDTGESLARVLELGKERGLLVVTAHFGNFELLPFAHSIYGHRIAIIHRPIRNPVIDRRVSAMRTRFGNEVVERKHAGPTMLKYLRAKWQVAVALDLDVRRGVFVDFFGLKASTSDGVARLAMAAGAAVAPVFMVREGESPRHRITVLPAIELVKTRHREECVRENTQRMTGIIEAMIRRHPDHWNWIHRRWKTRPPGEQRFY